MPGVQWQLFFDTIDEPLFRVCGGCGELAHSTNAVLKLYDPSSDCFAPLRNDYGQVEIIPEGLVAYSCEQDSQHIWLCDRCYRSMQARTTPKFSRCSGFRIGSVPEELAVSNRMETRLIGLGITFTTCDNLYRDGQEFTRGNAINYWNEHGKTVRELPRPLKTCGVVFLASKSDKATKYFRVRPDLIRRALIWLISINPLYKYVTISETNLRALEEIDHSTDVPTIPVTDEEVQELQGHPHQVNAEKENSTSRSVTTGADLSTSTSEDRRADFRYEVDFDLTGSTLNDDGCADDPGTVSREQERLSSNVCQDCIEPEEGHHTDCCRCTACNGKQTHTCDTFQNNIRERCSACVGKGCVHECKPPVSKSSRHTPVTSENVSNNEQHEMEDVMDNLTESFELEGNQNSIVSELERIMNAVGVQSLQSDIPIGELRCQGDPIDEYRTQQMMQYCFPTLFPDGYGGYHPANDTESRLHEYGLAEYCAHLMK